VVLYSGGEVYDEKGDLHPPIYIALRGRHYQGAVVLTAVLQCVRQMLCFVLGLYHPEVSHHGLPIPESEIKIARFVRDTVALMLIVLCGL
jgi:hypothetical protein